MARKVDGVLFVTKHCKPRLSAKLQRHDSGFCSSLPPSLLPSTVRSKRTSHTQLPFERVLLLACKSDYLFLSPAFPSSVVAASPEEHLVTSLPGLKGEDFPTKHYAGHIPVVDGFYFYWLFESASGDPSSDPLVIWLNGGPVRDGQVAMAGLARALVVAGVSLSQGRPDRWRAVRARMHVLCLFRTRNATPQSATSSQRLAKG